MYSIYNLIISKSDTALMREKASKLYGAAKMLDLHLKGTFDDIISNQVSQNITRNKKIIILNKKLSYFTDLVANCFPPLGVGYYSKDLDAIITYGPSYKFGDKVGESISIDHLGREAMRENKELLITGDMVRGNCMACFLPLVRKKKTVGYVWATEPVQEIYKQLRETKKNKTVLTDFKAEMDVLPLLFLFNNTLSNLIKPRYKAIIKGTPEEKILLPISNKQNKNFLKFFKNILLYLETIQDYGQNILENINSSIIIVDLKGKILYFNKSAYWLFKKKRKEEIIGNFYFNILVGSEKLELKNIIKEVIKTEKTFLEYEIDFPEFNKQIIINMRVSILKDINKQKVGLVIIIEDITSDKKTGKEKIKDKKLAAFGELANSLAHEISNPLAAIKALVQLLPEKLDDKKFISRFVKEVTNEVERIDKIFKNLFYVTRSPRNSFKNINLNKIVSEVLFSLEGLSEKKNIQIDRKLKNNLPQIVADTNQLKQVFLNIILNAFHAMPEGGLLKVFTNYDHKNDLVKIMFVDNGYGINKKLLDKVFDPFFSTKEDGTGIGLSVSYNIVQQHGGFIQLSSTEGKGSTFTVVLPCSSGVNCFEKQNISN